MKNAKSPFTGMALAGFCRQTAILLKSAVPLYEGMLVMAEDASTDREKEILTAIADKLRVGESVSKAIREAECFPPYMEEMIFLGEQTGTLDTAMEGLADYYEQETRTAESLKRALAYPTMMIFMLLLILFVLFVKVMPVFSGVYAQLGTVLPPLTLAAIRLGGLLSGLALAVMVVLAVLFLFFRLTGRTKNSFPFAAGVIKRFQSRSKIAKATALRRFCSTMSVSLNCGLAIGDGLEIAGRMVGQAEVADSVAKCREAIAAGKDFYEAVRESRLFSGFELQLIRVANRTGSLSQILNKMADDYDQKSNDLLDSMVSRLEPTIVSILAVAVGLVLLSVMLPLVGVLSAIG